MIHKAIYQYASVIYIIHNNIIYLDISYIYKYTVYIMICNVGMKNMDGKRFKALRFLFPRWSWSGRASVNFSPDQQPKSPHPNQQQI